MFISTSNGGSPTEYSDTSDGFPYEAIMTLWKHMTVCRCVSRNIPLQSGYRTCIADSVWNVPVHSGLVFQTNGMQAGLLWAGVAALYLRPLALRRGLSLASLGTGLKERNPGSWTLRPTPWTKVWRTLQWTRALGPWSCARTPISPYNLHLINMWY